MARKPVLIAAAVGVVVMAAMPADATSVNQTSDPVPGFDVPPDVCGFAVHVDFPISKEQGVGPVSDTVTSPAPDVQVRTTTFRVAGHLVMTLTNPVAETSLTENASGPAILSVSTTYQRDPFGGWLPTTFSLTQDGEGRSVNFASPDLQSKFGVPGIFTSAGPSENTVTIDLASNTVQQTQLNFTGRVVDLCSQLR